MGLSQRKTQKLISNPGSRTCATVAGTGMPRPSGLFWVIRELAHPQPSHRPAYVNLGGMLWPALARFFVT